MQKTPLDKEKPRIILFQRLHWIYIIAAALLLLLPLINYALTNRYGEPFTIKFFLDPALWARLEPDRNFFEFFGPHPLYMVLGVIPGCVGILLLLYTIGTAWSHQLIIDNETAQFIERKAFFISSSKLNINEITIIGIGQRRQNWRIWGMALFLFVLAGMIWQKFADSLQNYGIIHYFSIYQDIWDNTTSIGTLNLGFHNFMTVLIMGVAALIILLFPRRTCILETKDTCFQINYSKIVFAQIPESTKIKATEEKLFNFFSKIQAGRSGQHNDKESKKQEESQNGSQSYLPLKWIIMGGVGFGSIMLLTFLKGSYYGDFLLPFRALAFLVLSQITINSLYQYSFFTQKIIDSPNYLEIYRTNRFTGPSGYLLSKNLRLQQEKEPYKANFVEMIVSIILMWEIVVIIENKLEFATMAFSFAWAWVIMLLIIEYFVTIILFYSNPFPMVKLFSKEPAVQETPSITEIFWPREITLKIDVQREPKTHGKAMLLKYQYVILQFGITIFISLYWLISYFTNTNTLLRLFFI